MIVGNDKRPEYERALRESWNQLGTELPMRIGERLASGDLVDDVSPSDSSVVVSRFVAGGTEDLDQALTEAQAAYATWRRTQWTERIDIVRKAAALIESRLWHHAAMLTHEIGKNWTDAAYDVQECVDVMRYYCDQMEANDGFERIVSDGSQADLSTAVLRPYGPWLVISPFNFAMALSGGPASAALVSGNTVVMKPSDHAPLAAHWFAEAIVEAGAPAGVVNVVTASGPEAFRCLQHNDVVAGVVFTGSEEVGRSLQQILAPRGIRLIAELGGKNPAVVMPSADLADAANGVARSAFGFAGQKCSACSRVYVHRDVYADFSDTLRESAASLTVGLPQEEATVFGPVISPASLTRYADLMAEVRRDGGQIALGGERLTEGALGNGSFLPATIISGLPQDHRILREEHFLPLTAVVQVADLDEAIRHANDTRFGLTAGMYCGEDREIEEFLDRIEAGVVYVNRPGGATTGARVNVQTFGGWKASGSSGANSYGELYLPQFLREQSRTFGPTPGQGD